MTHPFPRRDGERARRPGPARRVGLSALVALALLASSCAYYNTFFFAKRNYFQATAGQPYEVEKPVTPGMNSQQYRKAIDYSKKLIANYPKSKWVDDAYLMWARSLLGSNDPLQTVSMLRDFGTTYPDSPLKPDAEFYLGVAYRVAHKPNDAITTLDLFLELAPKHELVPYAHLERARALLTLNRPGEAAVAANRAAEAFKKGRPLDLAVALRAESRLASGEYVLAREDYRLLGRRAVTDEERFNLLLEEVDCLEAARDYDTAIGVLQRALAHEIAPALTDTSRARAGGMVVQSGPPGSADRWGRLTMRIGTIRALQGREEEALAAYRDVIDHFMRMPLAAEAQYRIGYVHETVADDFETARAEYAKVRVHSANSVFATQATQRAQNLERLAQFRAADGDTSTKRAEGAFLLAEQYLFQLDKPDRAFAVYDSVANMFPGTAWEAKARNAQAWMLRNKYERPQVADSLLWVVVRRFPATEAQIAARDYLESRGHRVPDSLIKIPVAPPPPPDTAAPALTQPGDTEPLGPRPFTPGDTLGARRMLGGGSLPSTTPRTFGALADSLRQAARADSVRRAAAGSAPAPADSLRRRTLPGMPDPSTAPGVRDTARATRRDSLR